MENLNELLPIEMLEEIFSYLSVSERLRCRSVCKLWKSILSSFKCSNLTIIRKNPCRPVDFIFQAPDEPVKTTNLIELTSDHGFWNLAKEPVFRRVREMTTFFSNVPHAYLERFYNQFVELESLIIDSDYGMDDRRLSNDEKFTLNLKFLKKLILNTGFYLFVLKTPELLYFKGHNFPTDDYNKTDHQEKIKFLDSKFINCSSIGDYVLSNLEVLIIRAGLDTFSMKRIERLLGKSNLKEVHLSGDFIHQIYPEEILEKLDKLRKGSEFELFVYGFYCEHYRRLSEMQKRKDWLDENTRFLLQNLCLMADTVHCEFKVVYNQLEKLGDNELSEFVRRFPNIRSVSVGNGVENEERLLDFLIKTKPDKLEFKNFNQHSDRFLNELGSKGKFLRILIAWLTNSPVSGRKFGFLFKLENLTCLKIVDGFNLRFVLWMVEQVQSLKNIRFQASGYELKIFNDWRMNGISIVRQRNRREQAKTFSNKLECIRFLRDLNDLENAKIDLKKLFELLPDDLGRKCRGYLTFPN